MQKISRLIGIDLLQLIPTKVNKYGYAMRLFHLLREFTQKLSRLRDISLLQLISHRKKGILTIMDSFYHETSQNMIENYMIS